MNRCRTPPPLLRADGRLPGRAHRHQKGCSVKNCERPHRSLGFCDLHYQRHRRGAPLDPPPYFTTIEPRPCLFCGDFFKPPESHCLHCSRACGQGTKWANEAWDKIAAGMRTRCACGSRLGDKARLNSGKCARCHGQRGRPTLRRTRLVECPECGVRLLTRAKSGRRKYCSGRCCRRAAGRRRAKRVGHDHRGRARYYGVAYEPVDVQSVYERDGWRCGICRARIDRRKAWPDRMCASVDHIVPLSEGGSHTLSNVQAAHWQCNVDKGAGSRGSQLRMGLSA